MKKALLMVLLSVILLVTACVSASAEDGMNSAEPVVGGSVFLGHYEQDNKTDNGDEPIEWLILDIRDGHALVISRYALDCQAFHAKKEDTSWASCSLRTWLNTTFFQNSFQENEAGIILTTTVDNSSSEGNPEWINATIGLTSDHLFLLSYREVREYFPNERDRKANGTEYARAQGAKFLGMTTIGYGETDWWLRTLGKNEKEAAYVGVVRDINTKGVTDKVGIRPAMWIDITADRSFFPYEQSLKASRYEAEGRLEDAAAIYESLGTYNGSETKRQSCYYQAAQKAMTDGNYANALRIYESIGDYEDSYLQGRACRYAMAVEYQNAGEYQQAIQMLEKAGQYKDSMERLRACYDKLGIPVYFFAEEAVNSGVDTGYAKSETITGNDRHFGWRLGRFFVSGFTRVNAEYTQQPIFIKTLGDSITLWFDLEQDIDCLNGNSNLVISEDQNGYNQSFAVSKTNFGRGTLIVRHTNYQNSRGEPQIYTDYLLAKGTSGADTKIVLREEGDYEVALDYEIQDNDLKHITNKYGNYQILLRFSVRNGNCMVYPFDVLTGDELQNTAITPNGFYLDLARSRYLNIDVKRSVIIEGPNGMIEDERFNRPAKDGDQYTAEGIYTISVSNRYTGESTVKTVFVGTEELLQEYIANGFSPDRLN